MHVLVAFSSQESCEAALPARFPERERKVQSWPVVTWLLSAGAWFGPSQPHSNANVASPTPSFMF